MSLKEEIEKQAGEIYTESYQMSIGELINLYRDDEMDIHPEFQRVFRWSDYQKTKLIESILLHIPIPPIFVSQCDDGTWDIIDGVQRLSTIFQFVGVLKDENGKYVDRLVLQSTNALPSLKNMKWEGEDEFVFPKELQLSVKRARFDIIIIKKESDANTKYELFQRLNTGGSPLSDQEVRNCLIIMANKPFYNMIESLSKYEAYNRCVKITDRKSDEQYGLEMLVRFLVATEINWDRVNIYEDIKELLDKETVFIAERENFPSEEFSSKFKALFDLLFDLIGEDVFRKYENGKHIGPFLSSAFQAICIGVYRNIDDIQKLPNKKEWLLERIHSLYTQDMYIKNTAQGVKSIPRFQELSVWGEEYFKP